MTAAKKKANELVDRYLEYVEAYSSEGQLENAKVCALILVSEIMEFLVQASEYLAFPEQIKFWQEVKREIKTIKS